MAKVHIIARSGNLFRGLITTKFVKEPKNIAYFRATESKKFVQNSINGLQTANFVLHCVKKPRHTLQVCLCFLPCSEQNFLVFASSSKFEQTLNFEAFYLSSPGGAYISLAYG